MEHGQLRVLHASRRCLSEPASAHRCSPADEGPGLRSVLTASPQNTSSLQRGEDIWGGVE